MEGTLPKQRIYYDPLYGHIQMTNLEWGIIHTPFYQRLRWIKQLGFTLYTFPGAEHSRFGHSIGVMYNAHMILRTIGRAVDDQKFFDEKFTSPEKTYHQSLRLAALLHDLGMFPFSHTTEMSYIRFGETTHAKNGKGHPDDHEHFMVAVDNNAPGRLVKLGFHDETLLPFAIWVRIASSPCELTCR